MVNFSYTYINREGKRNIFVVIKYFDGGLIGTYGWKLRRLFSFNLKSRWEGTITYSYRNIRAGD